MPAVQTCVITVGLGHCAQNMARPIRNAGSGIGMDYTTLGRTGLRVSVAGLGCGGFSRLGMSTGKSEAESVALVRLAIDSGITLIDTAANYGTEEIVGKAISVVPRESI